MDQNSQIVVCINNSKNRSAYLNFDANFELFGQFTIFCICDVTKQNELELANNVFRIEPNKADNFFVSYCFCNPPTACVFGTK